MGRGHHKSDLKRTLPIHRFKERMIPTVNTLASLSPNADASSTPSTIIRPSRVRSRSPPLAERPYSFPRSSQEEIKYERKQQNQKLAMLSSAVSSTTKASTCAHSETAIVHGVIECMDCGQHIEQVIDQDQEWRYYGDGDGKNTSDPSRCQFRRVAEKGIRKDLLALNLPNSIVNLADEYYCEVTRGEIKRGDLRKGIMYACVFEAYNTVDKCQLPNDLLDLFGIDRRSSSRGTTYFYKHRDKRSRKYVTAENFIPKICQKFNCKEEIVDEVLILYNQLKNKSMRLDHSYPQSVSCGCVYYVMKRHNADFTAEDFGKIVGLSSITVTKKANEIEDILNS